MIDFTELNHDYNIKAVKTKKTYSAGRRQRSKKEISQEKEKILDILATWRIDELKNILNHPYRRRT